MFAVCGGCDGLFGIKKATNDGEIILGNLVLGVQEDDIKQIAHGVGPTEFVKLNKSNRQMVEQSDGTRKSVGTAIVRFTFPNDAALAISLLHCHELKGVPITAIWANEQK